MKLWRRYFFGEIVKTFLAVLSIFCGLYIVIDYSVHSRLWAQLDIPGSAIVTYYLSQLSNRALLLVPLSLLLATIKVLTTFNTRNELLALLAAGMPLRWLCSPLIWVALLVSCSLYANLEWGYPSAKQTIERFQELSFRTGGKRDKPALNAVRLKDDSTLLYHTYDPLTATLYDVWWLQAGGEQWHMRSCQPHEQPPVGHFVDHLQQDATGATILADSFRVLTLEQMHFGHENLAAVLLPPDALPLSTLWQQRPRSRGPLADRQAQVLTHFYAKLAIPWLCLLVVLAVTPSCVRFGRHLPLFLIYGLSILAFLSFQTAMSATVILGKNHVVNPLLAISAPMVLLLAGAGWRYCRIR